MDLGKIVLNWWKTKSQIKQQSDFDEFCQKENKK